MPSKWALSRVERRWLPTQVEGQALELLLFAGTLVYLIMLWAALSVATRGWRESAQLAKALPLRLARRLLNNKSKAS
jgi:hypothetical protein